MSHNQSIGDEVPEKLKFFNIFCFRYLRRYGFEEGLFSFEAGSWISSGFELEKNYELFGRMFIFSMIILKESLLFQAVRIQQVPASTLSNAGGRRISLICFRFPFLIFKSISIRFCPSLLLPNSVMSYALKILYLNYTFWVNR